MSNDILDRRVQKTRQLLKDALITLILEKGFEAVTIQQILDKANVGRSTFYMHFESKYELLHSCFEEFNNLFGGHEPGAANYKRNSKDINDNDFILNLFILVERNHRLFKALLGNEGSASFTNPIHQYIWDYIYTNIKKLILDKKQNQLKLEMLVNYITSALIGTVRWWVYKDMPYTAGDMDKYFKQLVRFGVEKELELGVSNHLFGL